MDEASTIHNPDRYMSDLRQVLSQGRKRIGLLIGAGAPTSILSEDELRPPIPAVDSLTDSVIDAIGVDDELMANLKRQIERNGFLVNIETILTQVRRLAQAIGSEKVYGLDGSQYDSIAETICREIGKQVGASLPLYQNPFTDLVSWISGTQREHPIEIFTSNYDLLIEEAFERRRVPFFDGFSGSYQPFFDAASVSSGKFPSRWSLLWKLHGSLGWDISGDTVVRTGQKDVTGLIYPDHLKYDQVTKLPYSALFERLRQFLLTPDTLLICIGFSFRDSHICAEIDEALAANEHTAVYAFQFRKLEKESEAAKIAHYRPNMSIYARDRALVSGVEGTWQPGELPSDDWRAIRQTFWRQPSDGDDGGFILGDFEKLSRFLALIKASQLAAPASGQEDDDE